MSVFIIQPLMNYKCILNVSHTLTKFVLIGSMYPFSYFIYFYGKYIFLGLFIDVLAELQPFLDEKIMVDCTLYWIIPLMLIYHKYAVIKNIKLFLIFSFFYRHSTDIQVIRTIYNIYFIVIAKVFELYDHKIIFYLVLILGSFLIKTKYAFFSDDI